MVCGGQEERDGAWQDARLQSNDLPAKWMEDDAEDLFPDFLQTEGRRTDQMESSRVTLSKLADWSSGGVRRWDCVA